MRDGANTTPCAFTRPTGKERIMERNRLGWSVLSATLVACAGATTSPETPETPETPEEGALQPAFMPTAPRGMAQPRIAIETPAPITTALPNTPPEATNAVCPAGVPGARVNLAALDDSVALEFSAPARSRNELRDRVHYLANVYGGTHTVFDAFPHVAAKAGESTSGSAAPQYRTRWENTSDGARIAFTPERKADLKPLYEEVAADAAVMSSVYMCPILSDVSAHWPAPTMTRED